MVEAVKANTKKKGDSDSETDIIGPILPKKVIYKIWDASGFTTTAR